MCAHFCGLVIYEWLHIVVCLVRMAWSSTTRSWRWNNGQQWHTWYIIVSYLADSSDKYHSLGFCYSKYFAVNKGLNDSCTLHGYISRSTLLYYTLHGLISHIWFDLPPVLYPAWLDVPPILYSAWLDLLPILYPAGLDFPSYIVPCMASSPSYNVPCMASSPSYTVPCMV